MKDKQIIRLAKIFFLVDSMIIISLSALFGTLIGWRMSFIGELKGFLSFLFLIGIILFSSFGLYIIIYQVGTLSEEKEDRLIGHLDNIEEAKAFILFVKNNFFTCKKLILNFFAFFLLFSPIYINQILHLPPTSQLLNIANKRFLFSNDLIGHFNTHNSKTILTLNNFDQNDINIPLLFASNKKLDLINPTEIELTNINPTLKGTSIEWQIDISPKTERKRFYSALVFPKRGNPVFFTTIHGVEEDTKAPLSPEGMTLTHDILQKNYSCVVSWAKSKSEDVQNYELCYYKDNNMKGKLFEIALPKDKTTYTLVFDEAGEYTINLTAIDRYKNRSKAIYKKTFIK